MKRYKAIIVGGGPAGSLTALSLLRECPELAGEVLVLEARRFPREKICGGGVSGRVTARLEELGLDLEKLPRKIVTGFTVCYGNERYYPSFGNEKSFVTRRSVLDDLLLREAAARGAEVRMERPVRGAYRERKGIAVLDREGRSYRGEILVCADGVNGQGRTWFGMPPRNKRSLLLQADIAVAPEAVGMGETMVLDFSPPLHGVYGYAWFFPSFDEDGTPVINTGISGGRFARGGAAALKRAYISVLESHAELRAAFPRDINFRAYPERAFTPLQAAAAERVIFVGEQLGVDPFNGEGLAICADSAAAAARCITRALASGDFSFRSYGRELLSGDFFPLYLVGRLYWPLERVSKPNFFLSLSTRERPWSGENILEIYARVFSGLLPARHLYTLGFWADAFRDIAWELRRRVLGAGRR